MYDPDTVDEVGKSMDLEWEVVRRSSGRARPGFYGANVPLDGVWPYQNSPAPVLFVWSAFQIAGFPVHPRICQQFDHLTMQRQWCLQEIGLERSGDWVVVGHSPPGSGWAGAGCPSYSLLSIRRWTLHSRCAIHLGLGEQTR